MRRTILLWLNVALLQHLSSSWVGAISRGVRGKGVVLHGQITLPFGTTITFSRRWQREKQHTASISTQMRNIIIIFSVLPRAQIPSGGSSRGVFRYCFAKWLKLLHMMTKGEAAVWEMEKWNKRMEICTERVSSLPTQQQRRVDGLSPGQMPIRSLPLSSAQWVSCSSGIIPLATLSTLSLSLCDEIVLWLWILFELGVYKRTKPRRNSDNISTKLVLLYFFSILQLCFSFPDSGPSARCAIWQ